MSKQMISDMLGRMTGAVHLDVMSDVEAHHGWLWSFYHNTITTANVILARFFHH